MAGTGAMSAISSAALAQMKVELTTALKAAGVTDASETDTMPKGFPNGVTWANAYKMVAQWKEDGNPATPGNLVLSQDLVNKNVAATKSLKELGYNDLSRFKAGTSVVGAIDTLYQSKTNGLVGSALAKAGIYDLTAFPKGTTVYQAFKLIEDPDNPGKLSTDRFRELKGAFTALSALGVTSLANFPRGTNALDAKAVLEPKAVQMLAMTGMTPDSFKNTNLAAALMQVTKKPVDADLPFPTTPSTDRLFQSTEQAKIPSYGKINPVKYTVYSPNETDKVKPNPPPVVTVASTAEILAANIIYWKRKT